MTIQELEDIEICAQRGLPVEPRVILMLTAYLRDTLQAKEIAEASASEAIRVAGLKSRYYTASVAR
jgi:hypothetical protein